MPASYHWTWPAVSVYHSTAEDIHSHPDREEASFYRPAFIIRAESKMPRRSNHTINGAVPAFGNRIDGSIITLSGGGCTSCEPNVPFIDTLAELAEVIQYLTIAIEKFFPPYDISMPFIGEFTVKGSMNIFVYTRVTWVRKYKSIYGNFDPTSLVHINLLKDIFASLGYDWRIDNWLVNLPPLE